MSHELRNSLNSMLILSRLLAENKTGNLDAKQVEFARTIHKAGNDLLTLINDVLDLSKVEAGKLELQIDQARVAELAAGELEQLFRPLEENGKGPGFPRRPRAERGAGPLRTDARRVSQILRNLLLQRVQVHRARARRTARRPAGPGRRRHGGVVVRRPGYGHRRASRRKSRR